MNTANNTSNKKISLSLFKHRSLTLALAACMTFSSSVTLASNENSERNKTPANTIVGTGTLIGAIAGGPIGLVVGLMGSALVADQIDRHEEKSAVIKSADETIVDLKQDLLTKDQAIDSLERFSEQRLALEVLFDTGIDELSISDMQKLKELSLFLMDNNHFKIRLSGHTDHRGTDEYNNILALERAASVASALEEYGVSRDKVKVLGFGSNQSQSSATDDQMQSERRVNIDIVFNNNELKSGYQLLTKH